MKYLLSLLLSGFLLIGCSKKSDAPEPVIEPTNALVGSTWVRQINPDLNAYLSFKSAKEVEFSTKEKSDVPIVITNVYPYSFKSEKMVYTASGFNYTGTVSGDTMTVTGTAGDLIYVKVK